jgi:hypothetical protein
MVAGKTAEVIRDSVAIGKGGPQPEPRRAPVEQHVFGKSGENPACRMAFLRSPSIRASSRANSSLCVEDDTTLRPSAPPFNLRR